jgi:Fe-S-cluster containining protein
MAPVVPTRIDGEVGVKSSGRSYDCARCPAYCCTYAEIAVEASDLVRLAEHLGVTTATVRRRYTVAGNEAGERLLRHQKDPLFGTACCFLDLETRRCTVYRARPDVCKAYPETARCGYYDMLRFERKWQDDPDLIVRARVL